jgi:hypothetical protein
MKSSTPLPFALAAVLLLLAGCVSVPTGPSVMALPGSGKSFEQFRSDDAECRQFAQSQIGGAGADQAATDAGVRSAAVSTVVGAVAGAALGGQRGAGVGAGTGLLFGSMAGSGAAQSSAHITQQRYDNGYIQCMYAKGEQVPTAGTSMRRRVRSVERTTTVTGASYTPPPPPEYAPPPSGYAPPGPPSR